MVDVSKILKRKMELKVLEKKLLLVNKKLKTKKGDQGLLRLRKRLLSKVRSSKAVITKGRKGRR